MAQFGLDELKKKMKTQSWVGTKGTQIWEELGKGVNMIKIQSIEFSKN